MAWVTFVADFDFSPAARKGRVTIAYKSGMTTNVTTECANLALGTGKARRAAPARKARNGGGPTGKRQA